nr:hypothetical protein [Tanacetum cinerariifolium]
MSKDPSIPRKNKVNWHYVRDDQMFTTIKMVSRHQNTQQFSAMLPIELTNATIKNSKAYKEYYAVATGATPPKTKASVWKTKSSSDTIVTPPPTAAAGTRLSTSAKGKQPAKASKAKSLTVLSEASGSGANEGTGDGDDDQDEGNDDDQDFDEEGEEFIHPRLSIHDEEETKDEERFDPIAKTPENTDDEGNEEENLRLNVGREEGQDEEDDEDELYTDMDVQAPTTVAPLTLSPPNLTPSTIATIYIVPQAPTPLTTAPGTLLQDLPNFSSLFGFDHRLKTLEANFFEFVQSNQFAGAISSILKIVQRYMDQRMNEVVKTVNEKLEAKVLTRSSNSSKTSYDVAADLSEMELKKILIEKIKGNKSIHRSKPSQHPEWFSQQKKPLTPDRADDQPIAEPSQYPEWFSQQKKPLTPDRDWNKTLPATHGNIQPWISKLAKQTDSRSSFNELMDTLVDFSAFLMNRLKVDILTPEWLVGPTYELMKGSCKSLVELEFFLEEVYKETTDQLDWINPEGQQYPHNLLKPLPLISNSRGHRVIPFNHFINNDLEYLRGGYDKHALWGISHWGRKRQQFYGFAVNGESARDVYSKRRIIAVTELKIVEWHNYKHLDLITVRRDDDKLYKFKEGDFKRLRIQDIKDMCVEDLQLGVESYQKKLNLTRPDTYHSDLKCKEAYTAYSNPRGFNYQNKDKQNMLMRIDELHKFSDGTLTDVRTALDDRLKGIRMKYLPQTIWRKSDKERAAAMIQAIDKQLKTRRIYEKLGEPEPEGSTQGYPLVIVEVLRYDKRSKSKNIGIVPTEMELILEHTQQEHPSDTYVFTMKMEILPEPTSNKLMVGYSNQTQTNDKAIFVPPLYC